MFTFILPSISLWKGVKRSSPHYFIQVCKTSQWDPVGKSQRDFLHLDECIVVDKDDSICGHASKQDAHLFNRSNPRGILHRAFSVFLFNMDGKLLLQQRASGKVTFPNVWTNTCCSHPLHGYTPSEIDDEIAVSTGNVGGIKAAALRKLNHELGIHPNQIIDLKYLTRLHYCAADNENNVTVNELDDSWGEHEIDYILFTQVSNDLIIKPNDEEVQDVKFVTLEELQTMMLPSSGLAWSPWFRIIVDKFLKYWWENLEETLRTDIFCDYRTIHRFDPI